MPSRIGVRFLSFFIFSDWYQCPALLQEMSITLKNNTGQSLSYLSHVAFPWSLCDVSWLFITGGCASFLFSPQCLLTVMLRSQNNYIASVLILFMLTPVCQSNSWSVVGTNTNYAAGELCGDHSISSGTHGLRSMGQDSVVRFVCHALVPLLFTSSKKFHVFRIWFSMSVVTDIAIALTLLWQLSQIKSPFKATQRCISSYYWRQPTSHYPYGHILFSLIRRLMASTIRTGTMTSVFEVMTLPLFLTDEQSNCEPIWQYLTLFMDDLSLVIMIVVSTGFAFCLGQIYTLTMLYNLNNRSSLRHRSANTNDVHRGNTMSIMTEICPCLPSVL